MDEILGVFSIISVRACSGGSGGVSMLWFTAGRRICNAEVAWIGDDPGQR